MGLPGDLLANVVEGFAVTLLLVLSTAAVTRVRRRLRAGLPTARVEVTRRTTWTLALATALPDCQDVRRKPPAELHQWLVDKGAVDYLRTTFRLFLEGPRVGRARVRDVRTHVVRRDQPVTRTWVCSPEAGAMSALLLMFDLDCNDDRGWDARLDGSIERVGSLPYFETHTVTLEPGELFEIRVHATVSQSLVEWELAVDVETAAGKRRTIVVRSPGNGPFRTSGCSRDRFEDRWYCGVAAAPGEGFRRADPTVGE